MPDRGQERMRVGGRTDPSSDLLDRVRQRQVDGRPNPRRGPVQGGRLVAGMLTLVMLGAGAYLLWNSLRPTAGESVPGDASIASTANTGPTASPAPIQAELRRAEFALPRHTASVELPDGWTFQGLNEKWCPPRHDLLGGVAKNVSYHLQHPDLGEGTCTLAWDMRAAPSDLIAVAVWRQQPVFIETPGRNPDTEFPLALDDARFVDVPPKNRFGAPPKQEIVIFRDGLIAALLDIWIGVNASQKDRQAVERIVDTVRIE